MAHTALYRKYRSQSFDDLVGQEHVIRTLRNSIEQNKIGHAYLFTGPRGTGKTSTARLLAKALNCTDGPSANPPADDPICIEIGQGNCMDVVELDAASESGVDDIRDAVVQASEYLPSSCRYKVFIIDEVHDLSKQAFDALLKTVEEPPPHVIFILATTEFNKVPPTIKSRCQRFEFHRGTVKDLMGRLEYVANAEGMNIEPAAIAVLARMADGGYRDALTLLEQAWVTADGPITLEHVVNQLGMLNDEVVDSLLSAMAEGDVKLIHEKLDEFSQIGRDPKSIVEAMLYRLADLTRAAYGIDLGEARDVSQDAAMFSFVKTVGADKVLALRGVLAGALKGLSDVTLPRLWLEAELVKGSQQVNGVGVPVAVTPKPVEAKPQTQQTNPSVERPEPAKAVVKAEAPLSVPADASEEGVWNSVVKFFAQKSQLAGSWLDGTKPVETTETKWVIEFTSSLKMEKFTSSSGPKAIQNKLSEAIGRPIVIEYKLAEADNSRPVFEHTVQTTAVESALEGDVAHEEFERLLKQD